MELYIVRHGQTDYNLKKIVQGSKDIPLNETGILDAKRMINEVKDLKIDLIISSTLKRAVETSLIISDNKIPIIKDNRLNERSKGDYEGKSATRETNEDKIYDINLNLNICNIEPIKDLCERVFSILEEIKNKYENKKVLLVTHSGTTRAIEAFFYGIPNDFILKPSKIKNCEIRKYKY